MSVCENGYHYWWSGSLLTLAVCKCAHETVKLACFEMRSEWLKDKESAIQMQSSPLGLIVCERGHMWQCCCELTITSVVPSSFIERDYVFHVFNLTISDESQCSYHTHFSHALVEHKTDLMGDWIWNLHASDGHKTDSKWMIICWAFQSMVQEKEREDQNTDYGGGTFLIITTITKGSCKKNAHRLVN